MNENYDMRNDWIVTQRMVPPDIVSFMKQAFFLVEIRRRVGEINGLSFEVRSREQNHSVPHVHASYGEYSVLIAIEDGRILEGNLPPKRKKMASDWVRNHKEKLLSDWRNYAMSATSMQTKSLLYTDFDAD